jgi:hypothetical protein
MAKLAGFGRYSAQGAAGILEKGFTARKETLATTVKELGGSQDGYWVVNGGTWDFMFLWNIPDDVVPKVRNLFLTASASGGFDSSEGHWLLETEVVDAARTASSGIWRPPNA